MPHTISLFLEKYIYRKATLVLGQSNEILNHIKEIYPNQQCHLYRNFPDHQEKIFHASETSGSIKLFYAGLLGVAQGVFEVCQKIDFANRNIVFHIFGDGAEKNKIEEYIKKHPEKNIVFHGMIQRSDLIEKLADFDIALVPLKTRIYGSVPSKIFEYTALGLPILYFGGGEGEDIVRENRLGWVADVGNFDDLNKTLEDISTVDRQKLNQMKKQVFEHSAENFNLEKQITELIEKGVF